MTAEKLPNWLLRCAENMPSSHAICCGTIRWTFAELERQVARLARQLAGAGIHAGSRVALLAHNGLPYVVTVHALTKLDAILVPLNIRLTQEELRWQLHDVHASFLLSDTHFEGLAATLVQSVSALEHATLLHDEEQGDVVLRGYAEIDIALNTLISLDATQAILYTSGTTGKPKGVIITYGMQWWNALGSALNLGHSSNDCWLACLPLFHVGGLSILFRSVIYGIRVVLQQRFDAQRVNTAIAEEHVTIISVVAVMLQRMLNALDQAQQEGTLNRYPDTLRCVLLGGGPAPRPLLEDCAARAIPVVQTYGLTESCSQAVTLAPADALRKTGSAGRPLAHLQLRIMDENRLAQPGEAGTIHLKGPSISPGYDNLPEATAQVFQDGWFSTGDIGYLDEEGYLYVLDRRSDLIISGGENIYPAEIEAILLAHPAVAEAGVCAQPDPQWGQVPVAFVRLHPDKLASSEDLLQHAASYLTRYKLPRVIYDVTANVEQLPCNSAGKLLRRKLPELLLNL